jgi:putative Holliday junction resolvase
MATALPRNNHWWQVPAQEQMSQDDNATIPGQVNLTTFPTQGKLLALDVGLARIGIAVCDPLRLAARPHSTLTRRSRRDDFDHLARIARSEDVVGVVCGLPLNMDGSTGPQAQTTRKWAMRLAQALRLLLGKPLPIAMWDERLSSFSAQELRQQWPRQGEDALAATVILQSFLAAQTRGEAMGEVIDLPPRPIQNADNMGVGSGDVDSNHANTVDEE